CAATAATPQYNITFAGRLNYQTLRSSNLANLWGYTDELGNEYAIVGVNGSGMSNPGRSEEHTSELQSRENLVCRLLLEKKIALDFSSLTPPTTTEIYTLSLHDALPILRRHRRHAPVQHHLRRPPQLPDVAQQQPGQPVGLYRRVGQRVRHRRGERQWHVQSG